MSIIDAIFRIIDIRAETFNLFPFAGRIETPCSRQDKQWGFFFLMVNSAFWSCLPRLILASINFPKFYRGIEHPHNIALGYPREGAGGEGNRA